MRHIINYYRGEKLVGYNSTHRGLEDAKTLARQSIGLDKTLRYEITENGTLVYSGADGTRPHNIPAAMLDEIRTMCPAVYDNGDLVRIYTSEWEYEDETIIRTPAEMAALIEELKSME